MSLLGLRLLGPHRPIPFSAPAPRHLSRPPTSRSRPARWQPCTRLHTVAGAASAQTAGSISADGPLPTLQDRMQAKLQNKKLMLNPFETLSRYLSRHFLDLDLNLAASKFDGLPAVAALALASGALAVLNCDVVSVVLRGLFSTPAVLMLQDMLDPMPAGAAALLLAAAAAFVGLWQLRVWWAAHMLTAGLSTSTVTTGAGSSSSGSTSTSSSASDPASSSSGSDPAGSGSAKFEAEAPHHSWQGSMLSLGRLGCVLGTMGVLSGMQGQAALATAAATYALSLLLLPPIASAAAAIVTPAASAALSRASSSATSLLSSATARLGMPQQPQQQQQQEQQISEDSAIQPSTSAATAAPQPPSPITSTLPTPLLLVLASEACFLALHLQLLPPIAALLSGAAVAALTGAALRAPDMAARLEPHRVSKGDLVAAHITLTLDNGIVMDTTHGGQPLRFRVGSAEQDLGLQSLQGPAPAPSQPSEGEGEGGASTSGGERGEETFITIDPTSRQRFLQLGPIADQELEGALRGTRISLSIYNPPLEEGGFVNPDLLWSQPIDEAKRKFGGRVPWPGQVFYFPISRERKDKDWVPVIATAVDEQAVHLDANYAAEGTVVSVHVDVQDLHKRVA